MSDPVSDLEKLRAELAATKAELAQARAVVSTSEAMIAGLKVSARSSPFALRLDYSRKFQGMSAAISLCMCWSRILRSVAAI